MLLTLQLFKNGIYAPGNLKLNLHSNVSVNELLEYGRIYVFTEVFDYKVLLECQKFTTTNKNSLASHVYFFPNEGQKIISCTGFANLHYCLWLLAIASFILVVRVGDFSC